MNQFGRTFSEEEQKEIVRLAARLQREQGESLSEDGLIRAASEAGIEPDYVTKAIAKLDARQPREQSVGIAPLVLLPLLLVAQWLGMFSLMANTLQNADGLQWWLVIGLCFAFGAVQSLPKRSKLVTSGIVSVSSFIVALLCGGFLWAVGRPVDANWPTYLGNIVLVEVAATLVGGFIGEALRKLLRQPEKRGLA